MSAGCVQTPKTDCYKIVSAVHCVVSELICFLFQLHLSKDFGVTWTQVTTYVVQFDWAPTADSVKPAKTKLHSDVTMHSSLSHSIATDTAPMMVQVVSTPYKEPTAGRDDDLVYASVHTVKRGNQVSQLACACFWGVFARLCHCEEDSFET